MPEQQELKQKVDEKAEAFAKAVKNSEEYKEFQEAREEVQNDEGAKSLIQEYQSKQMKFQQEGMSPDLMEEMKEAQDKMQENKKVQKLQNAEENFIGMLQESNKEICENLSMSFGDLGGGCC